VAALHHPLAERKHKELIDAITACSGLWLEATSDKFAVVPGGTLKFTATALNRENLPVQLESVSMDGIAHCPSERPKTKELPKNQPENVSLTVNVAPDQEVSQPYWLRYPKQGETYTVPDQLEIGLAENPPLFQAHFRLLLDGQEVSIERPAVYRYTDRVQGERIRPIIVQPPIAVEMPMKALVFPSASPKAVEIQVKANVPGQSGTVRLDAPAGWRVDPAVKNFQLSEAGQDAVVPFELTPPSGDARGDLKATARVDDHLISVGDEVISFPHIPTQMLFPPATTAVARADIRTLARNIGYVMGAGDEIPEALRQIGIDVTLLTADDLVRGDLSRFDAILTGVRAYNTRSDLRANEQRLLDYVAQGGTVVVQYNVLEGGFGGGDPNSLAHIGPYPMKIGRERVTVEQQPVAFPTPDSPLLREPNKITEQDFDGWVQERGLYFASEWDPRYKSLFETHDPGEKPLLGGTLYTKYGKGAYVFTAFSWFRELPAGVPGAFRIFANLVSAGKTL
jgi:hypothetical protein